MAAHNSVPLSNLWAKAAQVGNLTARKAELECHQAAGNWEAAVMQPSSLTAQGSTQGRGIRLDCWLDHVIDGLTPAQVGHLERVIAGEVEQ